MCPNCCNILIFFFFQDFPVKLNTFLIGSLIRIQLSRLFILFEIACRQTFSIFWVHTYVFCCYSSLDFANGLLLGESVLLFMIWTFFANGLLFQALIVSCCGCFNGRTLGVISMSCDNEATRGFGPLMPGHLKVDFGDAEAVEKIFKGYELFYTLFFTCYQYIWLTMTYLWYLLFEFSPWWTAENGNRIAAFILEPIQGEAGVCSPKN